MCAVLTGCGQTRTVTVTLTRTETRVVVRRPGPAPLPRLAYASARPSGVAPYAPFVPTDADPTEATPIPRAAVTPPQLALEWERPRGGYGPTQHAIDLWQLRRDGKTWRLLYRMLAGRVDDSVPVQHADVDGDGHDDVLVGWESGTGMCGARVLLSTARGRVRRLFARSTCDTGYALRRGGLVTSGGWYTAHDAHCCPTFTLVVTRSWNGTRLRATRRELWWNCSDRSCSRWRRGPLRFVPRHVAFWDARRGIAVGGARPWLFGRTTNGGRTWRIVDASPLPVGAPRVRGPGRAWIPFRRGEYRRAFTRDYGRTWLATR